MVNAVILIMTGIVLAGGENSRMGSDKAFLKLDGVTMIERVLLALHTIADQIIVVTNSPQRYGDFDARVVTDKVSKRGPLTGIYSGLVSSKDEYNFIVACDMPFLEHRLISYMTELTGGYDIVVPCMQGRMEPLHAIYSKQLLPVIEKRLQENVQQLQGLFSEARIRQVTEEEIDRFDPKRRSFININTPEEYKEALCLD